MSLRQAVDRSRAYLCLECGICTGSCPVSRFHSAYSPRLTVEKALLFEEQQSLSDPEIWSCLTCGTCDVRCPSTVDFTGFMRDLRERARAMGYSGICTHAETIEAMVELQVSPRFRKSYSWLKSASTLRKGKIYYFAGCLPFFDVIFEEIGFEGKKIGISAVRLLNALGIKPAISSEEVCCGHDAYWTGQIDLVKTLAKTNLRAIRKTGAKQVIFSCPECYYMFKHIYPDLVGDLGFEPVYILKILLSEIDRVRLRSSGAKVTYQDSCRLARIEGMVDEPRQVIKTLPETELVEMRRAGRDAVCCGSSSWVSCSRVNKQIQLDRLNEAASTGANLLVTSCPKCNIHLRCALRDEDCKVEISIVDLMVLLADHLGGGKRGI